MRRAERGNERDEGRRKAVKEWRRGRQFRSRLRELSYLPNDPEARCRSLVKLPLVSRRGFLSKDASLAFEEDLTKLFGDFWFTPRHCLRRVSASCGSRMRNRGFEIRFWGTIVLAPERRFERKERGLILTCTLRCSATLKGHSSGF